MLSMLKHYHLATIPFTVTLPAVWPSVCRDLSDVEAGWAIDLTCPYIDSSRVCQYWVSSLWSTQTMRIQPSWAEPETVHALLRCPISICASMYPLVCKCDLPLAHSEHCCGTTAVISICLPLLAGRVIACASWCCAHTADLILLC